MSIKDNYTRIQAEIKQICDQNGTDPHSVQVVAVTKYVNNEIAKEAVAAGVAHLAENRSEGMLEKMEDVQGDFAWHFIGSLQTRKVRDVINKIDYLHSLDRPSLAKEVDKRLEDGRVLKCFVQVNVSGEESKFGMNPEEVIDFIKDLEKYKSIQVIGLMTMAPFYDDPEQTRPVFAKLRELRDEINALGLAHAPCEELSMGMSNDYHVALEEGATFIRIGSALVGRDEK